MTAKTLLKEHAESIWKVGGYLQYRDFVLEHVFPSDPATVRESRTKWLLLSDEGRRLLEESIRQAGEWAQYRRLYHDADQAGASQMDRAKLSGFLLKHAERVLDAERAEVRHG